MSGTTKRPNASTVRSPGRRTRTEAHCDAIRPDFFRWHICTPWVPGQRSRRRTRRLVTRRRTAPIPNHLEVASAGTTGRDYRVRCLGRSMPRHFNRGRETCIQVRGVRPFAHRSEIGVRVLGFLAFGEGKDSLNAVGMDD